MVADQPLNAFFVSFIIYQDLCRLLALCLGLLHLRTSDCLPTHTKSRVSLHQGSANSFCKGTDGKYFRFCEPGKIKNVM